MTIDEAIKELEAGLADKWCPWSKQMKASIRMGIEALKRLGEYRRRKVVSEYNRLPGETKD